MPEERESMLQEAGRKIRRKREESGLSLEDVHEGTKIRINFLQGIEQGDYSGFPGTVYVRGFIRTYLQFLGAEELWSEFLPMLSEGIEKKRPEEEPVVGTCAPPAKGFKPASKLWLVLLLLLVVTGSGWYVWYSWEQSGVSIFSSNEERESVSDSTTSGRAERAEQPSGRDRSHEQPENRDVNLLPEAASSTASEGTGDDESVVSATESQSGLVPPPTAAELVGASEPVAVTPTPVVEEKKERELIISANGDCWVRVRRGTRTIFERTMRAGDTANFEATERLNVTFGRGSAVRVTWNGKDIGSPGRGVERVYFDPDGSTGRFD